LTLILKRFKTFITVFLTLKMRGCYMVLFEKEQPFDDYAIIRMMTGW